MTANNDLTSLWKALSDPTRRRILDLLADGPMTTGRIAAAFPISRIAVMRHLGVLAAAGIVVNRKRGRERWHYLNFVPLQQAHERWFRPRAAAWAASLGRLKDRVEGMEGALAPPAMIDLPIDIAQEIVIAAPRARVFAALTSEPGAWWGLPYLTAEATGLALDPRLGGLFHERWGGSAGKLLATVTAIRPDDRLQLTGPFHLGLAHGVADFQLTEDDGRTVVGFTHRAFGDIGPETADAFAGGWTELLGRRLTAFVERGERLGIDDSSTGGA